VHCLQASVPQLPCCKGNQGGVVLAYNCYLRIQVYTYYDLALDAPPPAAEPAPPVPSPPPAGETSGECVKCEQNSGLVDFLSITRQVKPRATAPSDTPMVRDKPMSRRSRRRTAEVAAAAKPFFRVSSSPRRSLATQSPRAAFASTRGRH
jgi:hypothetical protein